MAYFTPVGPPLWEAEAREPIIRSRSRNFRPTKNIP